MHHQNSLLGNMLEANQMHTSLAFKFLMSRRHLSCSILLYWGVTIFIPITWFSNYSVRITENFESAYSSCFVGSRTSSLPSGFLSLSAPTYSGLNPTEYILMSPWAHAAAKSLQSYLTLCDPIDGSLPGSPVPGILQARTLEWVGMSFSNAWKWKVKVKSLSRVRLFVTPWTAAYQAPPSMGFSRQEYWSGWPLPSPPWAQVQIPVVVSFPRNETLKNPPGRIILGRKILLRN